METNGHNEAVIRELIISNQSGLHARPAAAFVKMANKFQAEITVTKNGDSVNGKSIMGLMTLAAAKGTRLVIETNGDDAPGLIECISSLYTTSKMQDKFKKKEECETAQLIPEVEKVISLEQVKKGDFTDSTETTWTIGNEVSAGKPANTMSAS